MFKLPLSRASQLGCAAPNHCRGRSRDHVMSAGVNVPAANSALIIAFSVTKNCPAGHAQAFFLSTSKSHRCASTVRSSNVKNADTGGPRCRARATASMRSASRLMIERVAIGLPTLEICRYQLAAIDEKSDQNHLLTGARSLVPDDRGQHTDRLEPRVFAKPRPRADRT